jgi:hypothetical protein
MDDGMVFLGVLLTLAGFQALNGYEEEERYVQRHTHWWMSSWSALTSTSAPSTDNTMPTPCSE